MTEPNRGPAWLVLPTYNEAENIEPFVAAARSNLPADARILIVDDGSPDGTRERADPLARRHPNRRRRPHPDRRRRLARRHRRARRPARRPPPERQRPAPTREGRPRARLHRRVPP